jgi:glycosidase
MIKTLFLTLSILGIFNSQAQIIALSPVFATENDTVVITYDATQGNSALVNLGPPDMYAHTGVITDKSTSNADWRYVQGNWGTDHAKVKMTYLGKNIYQIKFHIRSFYSVPSGETVKQLAFVFRNRDGSKVGRSADGTDIYVPLFGVGTFVKFTTPNEEKTIFDLNDSLKINAIASQQGLIEIFNDGVLLDSAIGGSLAYILKLTQSGNHVLKCKLSTSSATVYDSFSYIVNPTNTIANLPNNMIDGVNFINDSTVILSLYAPNKKYVYAIGDFNNWKADINYYMNKTPDGNRWWIELKNLTPNFPYGLQYLVDGTKRIADPYSTLVLDASNDPYINSATFSNLKPYPSTKTTGIVGVFETGTQAYDWKATNYQRPDSKKLNIYELHLRDFIAAHNYKVLADTLQYLKRLGINAIELMPVNEFEGNNSWGYNTSFHMALDKYYGKAIDFKKFIDLCHQNEIAVILDVVFNHAFSQNSLCQLYWDDVNFQPASDNPWLNVTAKHPFNVGYDFNHESAATQYYMDHILAYWLKEFKVDGFRFDLSKGFTQKNTGSDVGAWGNYDASRIALLKRMKNELDKTDPTIYSILEHFANNDEETELANYGFFLWGNLNHQYNEASMGFSSDFTWSSYKNRGWNNPQLVSYMESHDEERLMYKNLQYGSVTSGYNLKDLNTALKRMELVSTFFFAQPGPKMIWQFGELGYDVNIDFNGRTGEKPIRWNYFADIYRRKLYLNYSEMMALRSQYATFSTSDYAINVAGAAKSIQLNHSDFNALVLGNFNVKTMDVNATFQNTVWWYEYFSGDSVNISNASTTFTFDAGEYRLYTTKKLTRPQNPFLGIEKLIDTPDFVVYPNPFQASFILETKNAFTGQLALADIQGKTCFVKKVENQQTVTIDELSMYPAGLYFLSLQDANGIRNFKIIKY